MGNKNNDEKKSTKEVDLNERKLELEKKKTKYSFFSLISTTITAALTVFLTISNLKLISYSNDLLKDNYITGSINDKLLISTDVKSKEKSTSDLLIFNTIMSESESVKLDNTGEKLSLSNSLTLELELRSGLVEFVVFFSTKYGQFRINEDKSNEIRNLNIYSDSDELVVELSNEYMYAYCAAEGGLIINGKVVDDFKECVGVTHIGFITPSGDLSLKTIVVPLDGDVDKNLKQRKNLKLDPVNSYTFNDEILKFGTDFIVDEKYKGSMTQAVNGQIILYKSLYSEVMSKLGDYPLKP